MGVDFFPCDKCGKTVCDAGVYERCDCGRKWCSRKCSKDDGHDRELDDCSYCRSEQAEDSELLEFMLKKHGTTREQLLQEWKEKQEAIE